MGITNTISQIHDTHLLVNCLNTATSLGRLPHVHLCVFIVRGCFFQLGKCLFYLIIWSYIFGFNWRPFLRGFSGILEGFS